MVRVRWCRPLSTSIYQEAKNLLRNSQRCQWRRATGDYKPSTDPANSHRSQWRRATGDYKPSTDPANSHRSQWRRATGDYKPSTDPVNRLARHEQTTIFRLRTGRCSPASSPEAIWHHGLCTLRLERSRTVGPPHPPGLFHLAATETPVMAAG